MTETADMQVIEQPWLLIEVADYLREDPRTTRRRVSRGELPVIKLPGSRKLLFDPAAVQQFIAEAAAKHSCGRSDLNTVT